MGLPAFATGQGGPLQTLFSKAVWEAETSKHSSCACAVLASRIQMLAAPLLNSTPWPGWLHSPSFEAHDHVCHAMLSIQPSSLDVLTTQGVQPQSGFPGHWHAMPQPCQHHLAGEGARAAIWTAQLPMLQR